MTNEHVSRTSGKTPMPVPVEQPAAEALSPRARTVPSLVRSALARLDDVDGQGGSIRLTFVRRATLVAALVSIPAIVMGVGSLATNAQLRETLLSRPLDVLPFIVGVTVPIPAFLGLRAKRRLALVGLLALAVAMIVLSAREALVHGNWDETLASSVWCMLLASLWREVDR